MDDIHTLSEEDIKLRYITPAILSKEWSVNDITMETQVKLTDGKINLRGNIVARGKAKYADYMLYFNRATPIAIVEAKDANHSVSHGILQAKEYAERFLSCKGEDIRKTKDFKEWEGLKMTPEQEYAERSRRREKEMERLKGN